MHPLVFVSPFTNTDNAYIARQREQLGELGYDVRPLSVRALVTGRCAGLARRDNAVVVSWLETRLFSSGPRGKRLSITGIGQVAVLATALALSRARVVYVVHNHGAHDVGGAAAGMARWSVRTLRRLADARVVHDPSFAAQYDATYVPHPLYRVPAQASAASAHEVPLFCAMGAIRPYKALDALLEAWPRGVPLTIAGKADPIYLERLEDIIARRELGESVTIDARFLSDAEFERTLARHDVLVLPHRPDANLVSGAFFAGVGVVRVILARATPFIDWVRGRLDGVRTFDGDGAISQEVQRIVDDWSALRGIDQSVAAVEEFGDQACLRAWSQVLATAGSAPPSLARPQPPHPSTNRG